MRWTSPEEHHLAVVRRVWRVATREQVDSLADDVPLHQWVHRVGTCVGGLGPGGECWVCSLDGGLESVGVGVF
jgi:hypothetical protein